MRKPSCLLQLYHPLSRDINLRSVFYSVMRTGTDRLKCYYALSTNCSNSSPCRRLKICLLHVSASPLLLLLLLLLLLQLCLMRRSEPHKQHQRSREQLWALVDPKQLLLLLKQLPLPQQQLLLLLQPDLLLLLMTADAVTFRTAGVRGVKVQTKQRFKSCGAPRSLLLLLLCAAARERPLRCYPAVLQPSLLGQLQQLALLQLALANTHSFPH